MRTRIENRGKKREGCKMRNYRGDVCKLGIEITQERVPIGSVLGFG